MHCSRTGVHLHVQLQCNRTGLVPYCSRAEVPRPYKVIDIREGLRKFCLCLTTHGQTLSNIFDDYSNNVTINFPDCETCSLPDIEDRAGMTIQTLPVVETRTLQTTLFLLSDLKLLSSLLFPAFLFRCSHTLNLK